MCNCGSKRQALNAQHSRVGSTYLKPGADSPTSTVMFKYTGSSYLNIRSLVNKQVYSFSKTNRELPVYAEDISMLQRYIELEPK